LPSWPFAEKKNCSTESTDRSRDLFKRKSVLLSD
jgi:hypothetical protein